jgi:hypothetical protein
MKKKNKYITFILVMFLLFMVNSCKHDNFKIITFEADYTTNFPNPERGLAPCIDPPWPEKITWMFQDCEGYNFNGHTPSIDPNSLKTWRNMGYSVVMIRYHIAEFRNNRLSLEFIDRLNRDFSIARENGFKIIPRFSYNWPMGGPDAPLDVVLTHISQLKTFFNQNADVIVFVDLGFIGAWGEQHHSCYNLVDAMSTPNLSSWRIIDSLMVTVPKDRMIAMRYPYWKFRYFGSIDDKPIAPLTEAEAYTGSTKARWAHHDDCLVCGEWNVGTWNSTRNNAHEIIDFLANDNLYVFQGGEPGDPGTDNNPNDDDNDGFVLPNHTSCQRILSLLEKEHWSILNASYGENAAKGAYKIWKESGCFNEIAIHLGYRFRLVNAQISETFKAGTLFTLNLTICNDGWASPHNPRGFEIVLRNKNTLQLTRLVFADGLSIPENKLNDPRFWLGGKEIQISLSKALPHDQEPGEYDVFMNLPDPMLPDRPEYSIRLANKNVWDGETGFNLLVNNIYIED